MFERQRIDGRTLDSTSSELSQPCPIHFTSKSRAQSSGSIEPGKLADLVVLARDPLTMLGGRWVLSATRDGRRPHPSGIGGAGRFQPRRHAIPPLLSLAGCGWVLPIRGTDDVET
jgi:hypothetical protein